MSVQICIINRSGVVLATDSLIRLSGIQTNKVTSATKLFQLSKHYPVGIMIYDCIDFMESIPWETIIGIYQSDLGEKSFSTLQEYCSDFLGFLTRDSRFSSKEKEENFIKQVVDNYIAEVINKNSLSEEIDKITKDLNCLSTGEFMDNLDQNFVNLFLENHKETLDKYIKEKYQDKLNLQDKPKLQNDLIMVCTYLICKSDCMEINFNYGGVIIAGYGNDEICPTMVQYEVRAIIDKKLIYKKREVSSIGNEEGQVPYGISPFGNTDTIDTYLRGIDTYLQYQIFKEIDKATEELLNTVQLEYKATDTTKELPKSSYDLIKSSADKTMAKLKEKIKILRGEITIDQIGYIIDHLRPSELVALAEALINLTVIRGIYTNKVGSEGGTINIAIITKGDGFEIRSRKEYSIYQVFDS